MSIRTKMLVLFAISGAVILAAIIGISINTQKQIVQIEEKQCVLGVDNVKNFLKSHLDASSDFAKTLTFWDEYVAAINSNNIEWIKTNVNVCAKNNTSMEFIITLNSDFKMINETNAPNELKNSDYKSLQIYKEFLTSSNHISSDIILLESNFYIVSFVPVVNSTDLEFKKPAGYNLYGRKISKELLNLGTNISGYGIMLASSNSHLVSSNDFEDVIVEDGKIDTLQENDLVRVTSADALNDKVGNPIGSLLVQMHSNRGTAALEGLKTGIIIVMSLIFLVVIICTIMIIKIVIIPINQTSQMLKDISEGEGDLTGQLAVMRNDEISQMARYFNIFVKKIRHSINI